MEFYHGLVTEKSFKVLQDLKKEIQFHFNWWLGNIFIYKGFKIKRHRYYCRLGSIRKIQKRI